MFTGRGAILLRKLAQGWLEIGGVFKFEHGFTLRF